MASRSRRAVLVAEVGRARSAILRAMRGPTITVITPTLNQASTLERTIRSVLDQEVPVEYIVVDGGSSDGSVEILESYADRLAGG